MKLRTIVTSKILAVAVVSAASYNQSIASPPPAPPAAVNADSPGQAKPPVPAPGKTESPALITLRNELLPKTREEAFAALAHFRPLCDADGFPLVGNVIRKTPHNYTPSAFCTDVRKSNGK